LPLYESGGKRPDLLLITEDIRNEIPVRVKHCDAEGRNTCAEGITAHVIERSNENRRRDRRRRQKTRDSTALYPAAD
jgi:hypothetical protein